MKNNVYNLLNDKENKNSLPSEVMESFTNERWEYYFDDLAQLCTPDKEDKVFIFVENVYNIINIAKVQKDFNVFSKLLGYSNPSKFLYEQNEKHNFINADKINYESLLTLIKKVFEDK